MFVLAGAVSLNVGCSFISTAPADATGREGSESAEKGVAANESPLIVAGGSPCVPVNTVVHTPAADLNANCSEQFTDFTFDPEGHVLGATTISFTDYVHRCDATGIIETIPGKNNFDMVALTIVPKCGTVHVAYSAQNRLGREEIFDGQLVLEPYAWYQASPSGYASWSEYMAYSPSSIAADVDGCVWVPNASGPGTLGCLYDDSSKNRSYFDLVKQPIESVAVATGNRVLFSSGDTIYQLDALAGKAVPKYVAPGAVLDFVVDYHGDIYAETTRDVIVRIADGGTTSIFATVRGDGKLAISPAGWLVRMTAGPEGRPKATFAEWRLW